MPWRSPTKSIPSCISWNRYLSCWTRWRRAVNFVVYSTSLLHVISSLGHATYEEFWSRLLNQVRKNHSQVIHNLRNEVMDFQVMLHALRSKWAIPNRLPRICLDGKLSCKNQLPHPEVLAIF
jgi:hypothetical protein